MGEIAEMIVDGEICQICGEVFDDEPPGHPRSCEECAEDEATEEAPHDG